MPDNCNGFDPPAIGVIQLFSDEMIYVGSGVQDLKPWIFVAAKAKQMEKRRFVWQLQMERRITDPFCWFPGCEEKWDDWHHVDRFEMMVYGHLADYTFLDLIQTYITIKRKGWVDVNHPLNLWLENLWRGGCNYEFMLLCRYHHENWHYSDDEQDEWQNVDTQLYAHWDMQRFVRWLDRKS